MLFCYQGYNHIVPSGFLVYCLNLLFQITRKGRGCKSYLFMKITTICSYKHYGCCAGSGVCNEKSWWISFESVITRIANEGV